MSGGFGELSPDTVGHHVLSTSRRFPSKVAVSVDGAKTTYAELAAGASRLAVALREAGLRQGDRVAFLGSENAFPSVFLATAISGVVLVPLSPSWTAQELAHVLQDSQAGVVLHDGTIDVPEMSPLEGEPACVVHDLRQMQGRGDFVPPAVQGSDEHCLIYTGGTTGRPKGSVLTHANHVYWVRMAAVEYGVEPEDVCLNILPLNHKGGMILGVLTPLSLGATVVLTAQRDPAAIVDLMARENVTWLVGVPTLLSRLVGPIADNRDRLVLEKIIHGGGPITPAATEVMLSRLPGIRFMQAYGSTEAGNVTVLRPAEYVSRVGTIGRTVIYSETQVFDDQDRPVAIGEVGELMVRGPMVFNGYAQGPTVEQMMRSGWFPTNDLVTVDADGFFTFVGRKDEMIITGGYNVHPREVEDAIAQIPQVTGAAVIGVPSDEWGTKVCAFVETHDTSLTLEHIRDHCRSILAPYKLPKLAYFVENLPKTRVGKISLAALQQAAKDAQHN